MKLTHRCPGGGSPVLARWGMDSEYGVLTDVLLGPMDHYRWQSGNAMSRRSLRLGRHFDREAARNQYGEMLDAYHQAGVHTHILDPDPSLPYQLYARDSSVMTPWGPIITQLYSPWRRGEWKPVLEFYRDQDIPIFEVITAGPLEGGDFMVLEPGLVVCGSSGERTSAEGLAQVQDWIEAEGWEFRPYHFDPYFLHLDVKLAMLSHKLAAACVQALEQDFVDWLQDRGIEVIDISYRAMLELGCNVVALGNDRVLLPADNRELADKCRAHGLTVLAPDVSMFTAGGGGVHCMCQPLRREPA
jgi:N-dimethylarginine dimethylaminohydrolase